MNEGVYEAWGTYIAVSIFVGSCAGRTACGVVLVGRVSVEAVARLAPLGAGNLFPSV